MVIVGIDGYSSSILRRLDALDTALRSESPKIQVVERVVAEAGSGHIQVEAERILQNRPNIAAFITLTTMADSGVARAVAWAGRQGRVKILAFDQSLQLLLRVRRGTVDSVVAQDFRTVGRDAVQNLIADREGQPYPATR